MSSYGMGMLIMCILDIFIRFTIIHPKKYLMYVLGVPSSVIQMVCRVAPVKIGLGSGLTVITLCYWPATQLLSVVISTSHD